MDFDWINIIVPVVRTFLAENFVALFRVFLDARTVKKNEENRLFREELKEYFKENVQLHIDEFLKNQAKYEFMRNGFDENAAMPADNGNTAYFEEFGNPLQDIETNIINMCEFVSHHREEESLIYKDTQHFLVYIQGIYQGYVKNELLYERNLDPTVYTNLKKCSVDGVFSVTRITFLRLDLILRYNNVKAFKKEVNNFKQAADHLYQCLKKEHPALVGEPIPFPTEEFKTIKF